ncbi:NUDIX domain-containing protein [Paenarthrobacter sp. NPDC058040]|uniref:NUDIX domain-containing protein n=1 Tax=unclassified Paenarthrobacter TaxID=2634190 RepID=UPI0036D96EEC
MTTLVGNSSTKVPLRKDRRSVVAVVIEWRGKIALLKRSQRPAHDGGRWHCVTGFLEEGMSAGEQALLELHEETGLQLADITELREGPVLMLSDAAGQLWFVHAFTAVTSRRRLTLDWEHDAIRWTLPSKTARFANRVSWLDEVLRATGHLQPQTQNRADETGSVSAGSWRRASDSVTDSRTYG